MRYQQVQYFRWPLLSVACLSTKLLCDALLELYIPAETVYESD